MKNTILLLIIIIFNSCANDKSNSSSIETDGQNTVLNNESNSSSIETDDQNAVSNNGSLTYYGKQISEEVNDDYSTTKELVMQSGKESATLTGEIIETCQKKGCWMSFDTGSDTLFIKFRDYGFFVPTSGVGGKTAVVEGELFLDTTSVEMLKHYAEDAGKSADEIALITEPSYDVNFIADGVIIKD